MDENKLNEFLGRFVGDLGATITAGSVVIGHRLGLYRGAGRRAGDRRRPGPAYPVRPAVRRRVAARPGRRRLRHLRRPGRHLLAHRGAGLRARQPGRRGLRPRCLRAGARARSRRSTGSTEAFRTGAGVGWHEHDDEVFVGCEQFFRPGYLANLVPAGSRRSTASRPSCAAGAKVADVGCGLGASTILLAEQYPQVPADRRRLPRGVDRAGPQAGRRRRRRRADRLRGRDRPELRRARDFDLVATFDCLHDMGDPVGAARHIRQSLAEDGTWLIVEPIAGDTVADNLNPVGRVYYGFSTFLCVPNALSQTGGYSLGAQAGREGDRRGRRAGRASPGSAGRPRRRSTSSSKRGPERSTVMRGCAGRARAGQWVPCAPASPTAAAMPCGRASVSTTRCTAPARPLSCCCRPGRSSTRASGSCRCPTSRGTPRSWCTTAAATGARTGRPARAAYDDAELVADAVAVLDAVGVQEAVVVGLSTGARVLLALAADHPDRVSGAVFVGADVRARRTGRTPSRTPSSRSGRATTAGGAGTRTTGAATRPASPSSSSARPSRSRTRPGRSRTRSAWALETDAETLVATRSPRRRVLGPAEALAATEKVRCPSLVMHGDDDRITPLSDGVALARALGSPDRRRGRRRPLRAGAAPGLVQPAAAPLRRGGDGLDARP